MKDSEEFATWPRSGEESAAARSLRSREKGSRRLVSLAKATTATSSSGCSDRESDCAAARMSPRSREMLGLVSSTSAMLAGVVAASNDVIFCSTPSSKMRKSSRARPRTRVPSGAVTMAPASTNATRARINGGSAGGSLADLLAVLLDEDSAVARARNSPVAASRSNATPRSSTRGRGSLAFCAESVSGNARENTQTIATQRPCHRRWHPLVPTRAGPGVVFAGKSLVGLGQGTRVHQIRDFLGPFSKAGPSLRSG